MTSRWQLLARTIVIGVPVIAAIPTALTAYQSYKHGIPFGEVSYRLGQWELWNRNAECAAALQYTEVATDRAKINVGACKNTGDIALRISVPDGRSINEWIAFDKLGRGGKSDSLWDLIINTVRAGETPSSASAPGVRLAQASGVQVLCQSRLDGSRIVRIVSESGKCYRETFSAYAGRVERREEVPCNTSCPPQKR